MRFRLLSLLLPFLTLPASGQENLKPTWETQKQARTHVLGIPAPRGQITARDGQPLAQTRISQNLAIEFPTPLELSNARVLSFARERIRAAELALGRQISVSDKAILEHYRARGIRPFEIAQDLGAAEVEAFTRQPLPNLILVPMYTRWYPHGRLAGHIIGYAGRAGRPAEGPIENNELLWPEAEGREGLEQTFNTQLTGKPGQVNIAIDAQGKKASEKITIPPQPGCNVITTLDLQLQQQAEDVLSKSAKRGAIVFLDPNNGDILAMASWPVFDPNLFVPTISGSQFQTLQDDPAIPLLPRAFRSSYPPGSTFKVFVGLAALQSGTISKDDEFSGPTSLQVGNLVFRNWKKTDAGMLNFREALTQSCNTWFYQVGIKTGSAEIVRWAQLCGLGVKTGIPLNGESEGRMPTDEYMKKVHGRRFLDGDLANLSIGQGDTQITPLQMAQAMGAIANGGTLYQTRLVQQVQSIDNQIVTAYGVRAKEFMEIKPEVLAELRAAMIDVVESSLGTAGAAGVDNVKVAGKTGTAQWGPKKKERTAAWFAGFAPADAPKYAFAALYEGEPNDHDVHGGTNAAPMIGKILKELFKEEAKPKKRKKKAEPMPEPTPEPAAQPQEPDGD